MITSFMTGNSNHPDHDLPSNDSLSKW